MRISDVTSTDLFGGTAARPLAIVRVMLTGDGPGAPPGPVTVRVEGPAVTTPRPAAARAPGPGEQVKVEVGVEVAAPYATGSPRQVTVIAEDSGPAEGPAAAVRAERAATITTAETGWT